MEIRNVTYLAIGTALFSIFNATWLYLYTMLGIKFSDVFDPLILFKFTGPSGPGMIMLLLLIGLLMAVSITILRYFSFHVNSTERIIMAVIGSVVGIAVGLVLFSNVLVFLIMMLFYMAGCLLFVKPPKEELGFLSKIGSQYNAAKGVMTFLAIGSLVASVVFVYSDLQNSQAKFKDAILNFQAKINIGSFIDKGDVRDMLMSSSQVLTKDQIKEMLITQAESTFSMTREQVLADSAKMALIEQQTDTNYQAELNLIDQSVDAAYARMTNSTSSSMQPIIEGLLEKPPFSYLFEFLPILTALMVASVVSFFGMVWIAPMSALLGVALPSKPEEQK